MQIRSITLGLDLAWPLEARLVRDAGDLLGRAREIYERAGFAVQTTRLCTQAASSFLTPAALPELARALDAACAEARIPYAAVGGIALGGAWDAVPTAAAIADAVCASERIFSTVHIATAEAIDFRATQAAAGAIARIAARTRDGFGNLRFAALARCPPGIPFFPGAVHGGGPSQFSLALQAADLVVQAFTPDGSLDECQARLVAALEETGGRLEAAAAEVVAATGLVYAGVDLSPAPFPFDAASVAGGLEALGVDRFGGPGTLLATSLLTAALRKVRLRRCGFSGCMMPVLEDSVLARRAAEGLVSVNELLLWSAVCGTGLDTVPLPGDVSEAELAAILLDVAALATALGKPLTARLFPVPGKAAGEPTTFDFPFFAASRILPVKGHGAPRLIARALGA
jgi:uncharacterized protein (UPF0210 family)